MGSIPSTKLINEHIVERESAKGSAIRIKIDQNLIQDAIGTIAFLEFEK